MPFPASWIRGVFWRWRSRVEICNLSFVSLLPLNFLSILRKTKHTGRNSHGDGDLDGNRGSQSREAEGFVCGHTGTKGGLLTPK